MDELVEDAAILDHCVAQFLGGGIHCSVADGNIVSQAIAAHNAGVADRQIGGALLKVGQGIAACFEEPVDEVIRFGHSELGVIDEAGLHDMSVVDHAFSFGNAEFADLHGLNAGCAVG